VYVAYQMKSRSSPPPDSVDARSVHEKPPVSAIETVAVFIVVATRKTMLPEAIPEGSGTETADVVPDAFVPAATYMG